MASCGAPGACQESWASRRMLSGKHAEDVVVRDVRGRGLRGGWSRLVEREASLGRSWLGAWPSAEASAGTVSKLAGGLKIHGGS